MGYPATMLTASYDGNAEFHVVVDVIADPPCVTVWGELDLASVAAFRDALNEALDTGARHIVVDVEHITFLGSTGIRELMRVRPLVDRLEVRAPTPIVRRALRSASLGDALNVVK